MSIFPPVASSVSSPKHGSAIKIKRTDSPSNNSSVSSTYSTGIPIPANISANSSVKSSPLTGADQQQPIHNCRAASCSNSNSPVPKKISSASIEGGGGNMFDRFKLFRNSANERINRSSPLHSYSALGGKDNGSPVIISDPVAHRSMTPFDPRMMHNFNATTCPPGTPTKMQPIPYPIFPHVATSDNQMHAQHNCNPSTFQNYSSAIHDNKFQPITPPIRTESSKQSGPIKENPGNGNSSSNPKMSGDTRKARSNKQESESSARMECVNNDSSARSSSRHERQKAKDLYTALKQRDRNKYNFSPQTVDPGDSIGRDSGNNKPVRMMSSEEFTQLIQSDPRLRQYVENQSNIKRNMINETNKRHGQPANESSRKQSGEMKLVTVPNKTVQESPNASMECAKQDMAQPNNNNNNNNNEKK